MAALDLVVQRLADVMQQAGTAGLRDVHAELCGQDTGEIGHLQRVVQHVLAVAGAVAQAAQQLYLAFADRQAFSRAYSRSASGAAFSPR